MKKLITSIALGVSALIALSQFATAQESASEANAGRLGLLTATSTSTHSAVGADLARILDGKSGLRIVPYLGTGSVENIEDLMSYRFADMALVNSDAMLSRRLRAQDDPRLDDFNYIARLFSLELHVIARADSGVNALSDLSGRRVAMGESRSGTFLTSSLVLRAKGVRATAIALPAEDGINALLDEEVDAVFVLAGKPSALLNRITADDDLVLLEVPLTSNLTSVYSESAFTSDDYPNLVRDKVVSTLSVDVILATYGQISKLSDEYKNLRSFVEELQKNAPQFRRAPSHPKWADFDLAAEVPGWERNAVVTAVLSGETEEEAPQLSIEELMLQGADQN